MDRDSADVLAVMAGSIGSGWTAEQIVFLGDQLERLDDEDAVTVALNRLMLDWREIGHPPIGMVIALCEAEIAERRMKAAGMLEPAAMLGAVCDGSRWIEMDVGERRPCPRCNPIMAEVYDDPRLWKRFLNGTPLNLLHEDVYVRHEPRADKLMTDRNIPDVCNVEDEPVVPPTVGYWIARKAYIEYHEERGLEPDLDRFDKVMSGLLRGDIDDLISGTASPVRETAGPSQPEAGPADRQAETADRESPGDRSES